MALSGTIYTNITGRQYRIEWSATQSIANNTSTITCVHKLVNNNSYSLYIGSGNVSTCNVGGVEKSYTNPAISTSGGTTHTLGTTVHTITHNSDGTKSVTIKGSYNISATLSGVWTPSIVAEGTITLDTIPRGSTFSVSSASADMGTAVTFTIDRKSTAFTHTLTLTWGGETSTIASNVATSYKWTIPLSLASDLPNSTSSGCYITCITYRGSTEISRAYLNMTLKVPTSVKPSVSGITATEAVDGIAAKFGAFIQSQSRLNVTISAAGSYSSTIVNYSTKILGKTYSGNNFTTGAIMSSGSVSIAVTVTDSRGRTATRTTTVTITAYSSPLIETFTAQRCNSDGSANDEGEYAKITYSLSITPLNNKNNKSQSIGYKIKDAAEYTTLLSDTQYTLSGTIQPSVIFSIDNSYSFALTVSDYFNTVTYVVDLTTGFTLVDYHSSGQGMAIGKVAEKEGVLEVALDAEFRKSAVIAGNRYAFSTPGVANSAGYIKMASIHITAANADTPITFVFTQRQAEAPMTVYVCLSNSTATESSLQSVTYEGSNYGAYLIQSGSLTWDLYVQKGSAWDTVTLQDWYTSKTMESRVSISFPGDLVDELPGEFYRATPAKLRSLLDHIFPVNSVYISYSHTSPAELFGGTWTRITNAFLWATTSGGTIGQTGGAQTHTLTTAELPSHTHQLQYSTNGGSSYATAYMGRDGNYSDAQYLGTSANVNAFASYQVRVGPTGSGSPHNNMPPYTQVSVWRRTE